LSFAFWCSCYHFLTLLVKIVRRSGVETGILLKRLDAKKGKNDDAMHWLVSVDAKSGGGIEEEISEQDLNHFLHSTSNSTNKNGSSGMKSGSKGHRVATRRSDKAAAKVSDEEKPTGSKSKGKTSKTAETKSKETAITTNNNTHRTRGTRRQRGDDSDLIVADVAEIEKLHSNHKRPRVAPKPKVAEHESVVEVKMNTGTLFMYRGDNPRAEFIRTV